VCMTIFRHDCHISLGFKLRTFMPEDGRTDRNM